MPSALSQFTFTNFRLNIGSVCCLHWEARRLMVSALDSRLNGLGLRPGQGTVLCSWARHFTLIVFLSIQVYKWVPANLLLRETLRWTSIPSRGGVEILLVASYYGHWDKLRPDGPLGSYADYFTCTLIQHNLQLPEKPFVFF